MKKFILTALILLVFLCTGPVNFSYAGDFSKEVTGLSGTKGVDDYTPIILAQADNDLAEEYEEIEEPEEVEYEEIEEPEEVEEEEEYIPSEYDDMPAE